MNDLLHILFLNSDDDVDQLFLQLKQVEPPPALVDTILSSVARLPRHGSFSDVDDHRQPWDAFGTLVVPTAHLKLS